MEVSRRVLLTGAATAATAATMTLASSGSSLAQDKGSAASSQQGPGIYRQKIGDILMTCVTDGANSFPRSDGFVSNVKPQEVAAALEAAFLPVDRITLTFTPVVLETSGRVIVVDTGLGEAAFKSSKGVGGQFHTNLNTAGYDAKSVDQVVISHFHADHIGGLITEGGKAAFPNSEILVPAAEYAFWLDSGNASRAATSVVQANFERAKRVMGILGSSVKQFDAGVEVVPGVTSIATPGHTPGHTSFIINSAGEKAIIQADATTHPNLFAERPGWHVWSDMDPDLAEQSRRKLYELAASEKILVQAFHFSFPTLGHIAKQETDYRFTPIHWNPVV